MKKKISTSKPVKKYEDGGKAKKAKFAQTKTKIKDYSDDKNYVTKKVYKDSDLVKEKTRRTLKGLIMGAPTVDKMQTFAKDYKSLGKLKKGGPVKSKNK